MEVNQNKIIELHSWKNKTSIWIKTASIFCFFRDGSFDYDVKKYNEFTKIVPIGSSPEDGENCICVSETPYEIMQLLKD